MSEATLYDLKSIERIFWPSSLQAEHAKQLLLPISKLGIEGCIKNVKTRVFAVTCDEYVLPLSVNEKEYSNSYVASNFASIGYLKELLDKKSQILRPFIGASLFCLGSFLKAIKINKVVIVNNCFFSTNLCPSLTLAQVKAVTACLVAKFPDHLILFRSVHLLDKHALFSSLKEEGYRMIGCRRIYTYNSSDKEKLDYDVKRKRKADFQLISKLGYEIVDCNQITKRDIPRILELYRLLYLVKYSSLSPKYTEAFIADAIENKVLKIIALKKNGQIDGVFGYYTQDKVFTDPFFGYDTSHLEKDKIYRMLSILSIMEAEKFGLTAHFGTGGDSYKKQRGLRTQLEYVAVYDKHLPIFRRGLWSMSEILMNYCVFPESKKEK